MRKATSTQAAPAGATTTTTTKAAQVAKLQAQVASAKPLTGIAAARAMAKGITAQAVAAQPVQATVPAPTVKATTQAAQVAATTQAAQVASTAYYQQLVTSKGAVNTGKPGTFFGNLQNMATQPITLQALIAQAVAGNKFTSKKSHAFVATVRTRHALTRLGYLVAVAAPTAGAANA
jgi:hypothetical protein